MSVLPSVQPHAIMGDCVQHDPFLPAWDLLFSTLFVCTW